VLFWITGHLPPTVELNALAMKRGEPTVYTFRQAPPAALQHQFMPHGFGANFPRMYNPRIAYNRGVHTDLQGLYLVTLKVGEREFTGRGLTGQAARHDAASRALEQLRQLPLPEEIANTNNTNENGTLSGIDDPNAELKSPVSLVHETALKRGLPVSFEVVSESGKPHIRTFMTKCTVGEKVTVGEGSSKKVNFSNFSCKRMINNDAILNACIVPVSLGIEETRRRIDVRRTEASSSVTGYHTEPINAS